MQHLVMRERRNAHLESNARKTAENFVHVQYLLPDGFGVTDQEGASGSAESIKLCTRCRGPSAFFTDLSECVGISWIEIVCGLLCRISEKADRVKADDEFVGGVPGSSPSFTVQIDQRAKPLWFAANDGNHQRKPERAGANE